MANPYGLPVGAAPGGFGMPPGGTGGGSFSGGFQKRPCINFAQGGCRHGDACRYLHDPNQQPDPAAMELYNKGALTGPGGGPGGGGGGFPGGFKPCHGFAAGNCTHGDRCKFSHDGAPPANPDPPGGAFGGGGGFVKKPCFAFQKGSCMAGDSCTYSHDPADNAGGFGGGGFQKKPCFAWQKGNCMSGDSCTYSHDAADNSGTNSIEYNKKPCFAWQNNGACHRGDSCTFSHGTAGGAAGGMPGAPNAATGAFAASFASFGGVRASGPLGTGMGVGFGSGIRAVGGAVGAVASMGGGGGANMGAPNIEQVSTGPLHPVVFAGHVGTNIISPLATAEETPGEVLPLVDDDNNQIIRGYEISLGKKAYFLEGVNIVRKNVDPPTFATADGSVVHAESRIMTGQTQPETQPFDLEILGRNLDSGKIESMCYTTVTGGCLPWFAFQRPANTIAIDYIVIKGNFENLSIVLHGGQIASNLLNTSAQALLSSGPPVPRGWVDPDLADAAYNYSSGEDEDEEEETTEIVTAAAGGGMDLEGQEQRQTTKTKTRRGDRFTLRCNPSLEQLKGMMSRPQELHSRLVNQAENDANSTNDITSSNTSLTAVAFSSSQCPYYAQSCIVQAEKVSALVDHVLEYDVSKQAELPLDAQASNLNDLNDLLQGVWTNAIDSVSLEKLRSSDATAAANYDSLATLLDDDSLTTVSETVLQALSVLQLSRPTNRNAIRAAAAASAGEAGEEVEVELDFLILGRKALDCAASLLQNSASAAAFSRAGGVACLIDIAHQEPPLPPVLQAAVVASIDRAVRHWDIALPLLETQSVLDNSGYQDLLELSEKVRSAEKAVSVTLLSALNTLNLVNSLQNLRTYAFERLDTLSELATQLTEYVASINATETAHTMVVDDSTKNALLLKQETARQHLHTACKSVREIHDDISEKSAALEATLYACTAAAEAEADTGTGHSKAALSLILTDGRMSSCLVFLAIFSELCKDYASAADWNAPHFQDMATMAQSSLEMMSLLSASVLACPGGISVIAASPQACHLMWQYLSKDEHVLHAQCPLELAMWARAQVGTPSGMGTAMRAASIGWITQMSCQVSSAIGRSLHVLAPTTMQCLQKSRTEEFKEDWAVPLEALLQLSTSNIGQELIAMQAAHVLLPLLLWKCASVVGSAFGGYPVEPCDWQGVELSLEILALCFTSDEAQTVAVMTCSTNDAKTDNYLVQARGLLSALNKTKLPPQIQDAAKELVRVIGNQSGDDDCNADSGTAVNVTVTDSSSALELLKTIRCNEDVQKYGLNALSLAELALRVVSSDAATILSDNDSNAMDNCQTMLQAALCIAQQTVSWARQGGGWAVDVDASVVGYSSHMDTVDESTKAKLFNAAKPMSLVAHPLASEQDEESSSSATVQEKMSSILQKAALLRKCLLSALTNIEIVITVMYSVGTKVGPHVDSLPEVICEVYSFVTQCLQIDSIGSTGSYARRLMGNCVLILSHYCPPSQWAAFPSAGGLIPYLHAQSVLCPRFHASNMQLVNALMQFSYTHGVFRAMSSRASGYRTGARKLPLRNGSGSKVAANISPVALRALQWQLLAFTAEDVEGSGADSAYGSFAKAAAAEAEAAANANSDHVVIRRLLCGSGGGAYGRQRIWRIYLKHRAGCIQLWQQALEAVPMTAGECGECIVPFSQARLPLSVQSTILHTLTKGEVPALSALIRPACERISTNYLSSVAAAEHTIANATSDPHYYLKFYLEKCPQAPATAVLGALTSCDVQAHRAASLYTHTLVTNSAKAGSSIIGPIMSSLTSMICLLLQQCENPLTRLTDHNATAVTSALQEPAEFLRSSNEICRYLMFMERLCAEDTGCLSVCAHGGLYTAMLCLHSLRQEVATLGLQVLTSCYRSLTRIMTALKLRTRECKKAYQLASKKAASGTDSMDATDMDGNNSAADDEDAPLDGVSPDCEYGLALALQGAVATTTKELACSLVELLPPCMSRFTGAEGALLLVQVSNLLPLLSYQHTKALLDNLATGMTVEVFCIKMWLCVEDSFQALIEASEVVRTLMGYKADEVANRANKDSTGVTPGSPEALHVLGNDGGQTHIRLALSQAAASVVGLRHALETVTLAYTRGWISLIVLQRTMRSSLVDPKHLIAAYQRLYMIWANDRVQIKTLRHKWQGKSEVTESAEQEKKSKSSKRSREEEEDEDNDDDGVSPAPPCPLQCIEDRGYLREDSVNDDEAWNAAIAVSLARLKDVVVNVRQYFSKQLDRMPLCDRFSSMVTSGGDVDLKVPLGGPVDFYLENNNSSGDNSVGSHSARLLQAFHSLPCNILPAKAFGGEDSIHRALQRTIVRGDDKRVSVFNSPAHTMHIGKKENASASFIRLQLVPSAVDPTAISRRRARRASLQAAHDAQVQTSARIKREAAEGNARTEASKKLRLEGQDAELNGGIGGSFANDPLFANVPKALLARKLGAKAGGGDTAALYGNNTYPLATAPGAGAVSGGMLLPPGASAAAGSMPLPPPPPGSTSGANLPPPPMPPPR